jgi:hypothetical protein
MIYFPADCLCDPYHLKLTKLSITFSAENRVLKRYGVAEDVDRGKRELGGLDVACTVGPNEPPATYHPKQDLR